MTKSLVETPEVQALLIKLSGQDQPGGDARVKAIVRRIVGDLFAVIDEFKVTDDEFWAAMNFASAGSREFGLWAAGLGVERFLDIRADAVDAEKRRRRWYAPHDRRTALCSGRSRGSGVREA